jgi:cytochrome c peroxidase
VTESKILEGLAAFINSMGSHSSKFDTESSLLYKDFGSNNFRYPDMYSAVFPGFTAEEQAGKDLYMQNCSSCHTHNMGRPFLFNSNNGLYASSDHDAGVGGITGMSTELGTFKVPTLRNIAITAPYMHDGSLPTLEAVIEHYSTGIKMHPNLAYELKSGNNPRKMNFTAQEKNALVQFLNTLTDEKFLVDPRFSDPFKP